MAIIGGVAATDAQTLAERLGYKKTDKLLIINNDDAGMCHAANMATIRGMEEGLLSSATIMMPCPWSTEMVRYAAKNPDMGFGVHLTLTSEWENYRWGTIVSRDKIPGLYDGEGYMWKSVQEVYRASTPQEALVEGRAQIRKALENGVPATHIDSHMGTYQYSPEYMNIYIRLAEEFDLPLRMPSQETLNAMGAPHFREECTRRGLVFTDNFIHEEFEGYDTGNVEQFWTDYISNLKPGVTEIYVHAAEESAEIRAISGTAERRIKELAFLTGEKFRKLIEDEGIKIISYRPLLELQRQERIARKFHTKPYRVMVAAHRGAHQDYPENSMAAFREAIRLGVDIIEADVRFTRDGVAIIMHDRTVDRTTDGTGEVSGMTFEEISRLRLTRNGAATEERVPSFRELLDLAKGEIMVDLDYKADARFVPVVCEAIVKAGMESQVLFFTYDYRQIPALKRLAPTIPVMPRAYSRRDMDKILSMDENIPVIHIDKSFYDNLSLEKYSGLTRIWANALGEYDSYEDPKEGLRQMLRDMPLVNVIQTDRPAELIEVLNESNCL